MQDKKCQYCKEPIPKGKRQDSKFCSNSCKAKHWEENAKSGSKKITIEPVKKGTALEGLRGIVDYSTGDKSFLNQKTDVSDVKETSMTSLSAPVETEKYKEALKKKQQAEVYVNRATEILRKYDEQIKRTEDYVPYDQPEPVLFFGTRKLQKAFSLDMELAQNYNTDPFAELFVKEENKNGNEKIQKELNQLKIAREELLLKLENGKRVLNQIEEELKYITRYEKTQPSQKVSLLLNLLEGIKNKKIDEQREQTIEPQTDILIKNNVPNLPVNTGSNILSTKELREMDYKCLNFRGKWYELLGQPAVVFHLAVHGKPGEGKSTFCIQFANYLAENFGNVVYISGEEGFSKTLRDKVVNNNITSPHLYFSNSNSFEKIKEEIENRFHFIFMDSLDTLKIDAHRLRELKEIYPNSAFITISQSTKDGKMRGSQEIIHDSDITLKVENGMAITTKNRFKERGMEFEVFPKKKQEKNSSKDLKNLI